MAKILFRLNGVSDEEANDVRELLTNNAIDYYETSAGSWGISMPAIWLTDDTQFQRARSLLDDYQNERVIKVREEYARAEREGRKKTILDAIQQNPAGFIVYLMLAMLVIYLSVRLVLDLAQ
ncbi:MAG: hypothetical protein DYH15_04785 [Nitrosomonas sp. PRO4]|nr:hypothetical protein [Nitrosomonas sp. PRO4]